VAAAISAARSRSPTTTAITTCCSTGSRTSPRPARTSSSRQYPASRDRAERLQITAQYFDNGCEQPPDCQQADAPSCTNGCSTDVVKPYRRISHRDILRCTRLRQLSAVPAGHLPGPPGDRRRRRTHLRADRDERAVLGTQHQGPARQRLELDHAERRADHGVERERRAPGERRWWPAQLCDHLHARALADDGLRGLVVGGRRADAELAVAVEPPAPRAAVDDRAAVQIAGGRLPGGDLRRAEAIDDVDGSCNWSLPSQAKCKK
jgi:hypothetical protein